MLPGGAELYTFDLVRTACFLVAGYACTLDSSNIPLPLALEDFMK
jgi:hypothetical protein